MAVNKVVLGNNTLVDLTGDTVTADKLAVGATAHASNGEVVNGTLDTYTKAEIDSLLDDKISEYSDAVLGNFRSTGATNLGNGAVDITATAMPAQSTTSVRGSLSVEPEGLLKIIEVTATHKIGKTTQTFSLDVRIEPGEGWLPIGVVGWASPSQLCYIRNARVKYDDDGAFLRVNAVYTGTAGDWTGTATADVLCIRVNG